MPNPVNAVPLRPRSAQETGHWGQETRISFPDRGPIHLMCRNWSPRLGPPPWRGSPLSSPRVDAVQHQARASRRRT